MIQIPRGRIRYYAHWAKIKPFEKVLHYIDDNNAICFDFKLGEPYANHIEMAGRKTACIISYGADETGKPRLMRHAIFPSLRRFPNKTHDQLDRNFKGVSIIAGGKKIQETAAKFVFDGTLNFTTKANGLLIERKFFPGNFSSVLVEMITVTNTGNAAIGIGAENKEIFKKTLAMHGHEGQVYAFETKVSGENFTILPGEKNSMFVGYSAREIEKSQEIDFEKELEHRLKFVEEVSRKLVVQTGDTVIDTMTRFAKIRASESIVDTKSGLMHNPGGGGYYAALWTNDQCEYVNPFFAYLGYQTGIDQSINCYELYKKYISPDKALITSIIAGGDGIWHGAGDRGDAAMYAYGAARFLLTLGDKATAEKFVGAVEDCLTFTLSQKNEAGIIKSDSDELENRFESGDANLCTSTLAYDALISASYLEKELGDTKKADFYLAEAEKLKTAIGVFFGANVEGYETYTHCKKETNLRSWIAMPLVVGIFDRAEDTKNALLSDKLRKGEGLLTRSGEKTFWDRSTLYTLRGLFNAGFADDALELLETYTNARLLGEHIPYCVEAFPEGNQAQLSAESGLYVRILIEGVLGYRPTGFSKFVVKPSLPSKWQGLDVKNMYIGGKSVDISVKGDEVFVNGQKVDHSKEIEV